MLDVIICFYFRYATFWQRLVMKDFSIFYIDSRAPLLDNILHRLLL